MSIFGRVADLFQAKTHKLLTALEDPNETLDLSYEKMITGLQETKRHLADVVAQQHSLERQIVNVDKEIAQTVEDARTAVANSRTTWPAPPWCTSRTRCTSATCWSMPWPRSPLRSTS